MIFECRPGASQGPIQSHSSEALPDDQARHIHRRLLWLAQTYRMGNKQEMVVAVRAPEGKQGRIEVDLTTDLAQDLFLHWGVRKQGGGDWVAPPKVQKPCR